jgi:hypothetical protein
MPKPLSILLGLVGGILGGIVGILAFEWVVGQGYYALIIPGALVGLGCGLLSGENSNVAGGINAALALIAGLVAEWRSFPFKADRSFGYFLKHTADLKPITLIMLAIGAFLGFWWGRERIRPGGSKRKPASAGPADSTVE